MINLIFRFCLVSVLGTLVTVYDALAQSTVSINTTSSFGCTTGEVVFFLQGGSNCSGTARILNGANWTISGPHQPTNRNAILTATSPNTYNQFRVVFEVPGTYTINATYDCNGSSASATAKTITVYQTTVPTVSLPSALKICQNSTIQLTATSNDGGQNYILWTNPSYAWKLNGVPVPGQNGSTWITNTLNDGDNVQVSFSSNRACMNPSTVESNTTVIHAVDPTPVSVKIYSDKKVLPVGQRIEFRAQISGAGPLPIIEWKVNGAAAPAGFYGKTTLIYESWPFTGKVDVQCIVTPREQCTFPRPATSNTISIYGCQDLPALNPTISTEQFVCATKFIALANKYFGCTAMYAWNFGDGTTSTEINPLHMYNAPGTYTASLTLTYNCGPCQTTRTSTKVVNIGAGTPSVVTETVNIDTDQRTNVLAASAVTFKDSWLVNHTDNIAARRNGYLNGTQGVWRQEGFFAYIKDRQSSSMVDLAHDGVFDLDMFNWEQANYDGIPGWIRANSVTRYSPYSFELENLDPLGVYSAAVYDYKGQVAVAQGVNMRSNEIAFTGFEYADGHIAGNWTIGAKDMSVYTEYKVQAGKRNMATVEASLSELQNVTTVDVTSNVWGTGILALRQTHTQSNTIVCIKQHPQNAQWSIVVFKTAPVESTWEGTMRIRNEKTGNTSYSFDNTASHTGKGSLKITANQTFRQETLKLIPGKTYWINLWVSVSNAMNLSIPTLGSNLGVEVIAKNSAGSSLSSFSTAPSGPIIEGWQQFETTFTVPANTSYIDLKFLNGSSTAWYDDLRIQPNDGNMKGFVFDPADLRLKAILDEQNFASFFFYDKQGNLYLTKKETIDGIKTISENITYQVERP